jgi:hypothetical protein
MTTRQIDPAAEGERAARRQNALGDPIGRIRITLTVDDEEPIEAEMDLLPDEDPILVGQRMVTGLFRLRAADARRRS